MSAAFTFVPMMQLLLYGQRAGIPGTTRAKFFRFEPRSVTLLEKDYSAFRTMEGRESSNAVDAL